MIDRVALGLIITMVGSVYMVWGAHLLSPEREDLARRYMSTGFILLLIGTVIGLG